MHKLFYSQLKMFWSKYALESMYIYYFIFFAGKENQPVIV
jgi:hypothetical protein